MGIGLSGMISGLDTDSLIKQLMSAERTKVTKVDNKITKHEWLTEKCKDLFPVYRLSCKDEDTG